MAYGFNDDKSKFDIDAMQDSITEAIEEAQEACMEAIPVLPDKFRAWMGSKVVNTGSTAVTTFTLFTKAELQAIVGTDWTPTGNNCSVFATNGDAGGDDSYVAAAISNSSVVKAYVGKAKAGLVRVNYLIIRFA